MTINASTTGASIHSPSVPFSEFFARQQLQARRVLVHQGKGLEVRVRP